MGQKLATQKGTIKAKITDKLKVAEHTVFQPYLDAIVEAKVNGDPKKIMVAAKELQKAVNAFAEADPMVQDFLVITNRFYDFRSGVIHIEKSKIIENENSISIDQSNLIKRIINKGNMLIEHYHNFPHMKNIVNAVELIINTLQNRINT